MLDTSIPPTRQIRYQLNPNYAAIDKLLATSFIKHVKETTWLLPIVIMLNKNGKLKICVKFKELKVVTNFFNILSLMKL